MASLYETDFAMLRKSSLVLSLICVFSGLGIAPVRAQTVACTSGSFTVTNNEVMTAGNTCTGVATIPAGVTSIQNGAFFGRQLTSVTLPNSVTTIGDAAFSNNLLTSVVIPSNLTLIGAGVFSGNNLSSVTIPVNVTDVVATAFASNPQLSEFTVDPLNAIYSSNGGIIYNKLGTVLVAYPAAKGSTFVIPDGVTGIGDSAFESTQLIKVTIPSSVTAIGPWAFAMNQLTSVVFTGNQPSIDLSLTFFVQQDSNPNLTAFDVFAESAVSWGATFSNLPVRLNYLANFNANSGTQVLSQRFSSASSLVEPAAPTRAGFTFDGWSVTDGGPRITFPYNPGATSNVTLFARWIQIPATIDLVAQAAAADLAARTIKSKSRFAIKPLASRVGVPMVSSKAKVTFTVKKSSRKVCTKSGSRLRTLKKGNCVVTFTVAEPKPKKGKKPKATKTVKTLVVQ